MFDQMIKPVNTEDPADRWAHVLDRSIREALFVEKSPLLALAIWLVRRRALDAAPKALADAKRVGRGRYMYPLE